MLKHQQLEHMGGEPNFIMRSVKFYRSALARQVGEAVRIQRRGGAGSILNSRAEFDRCRIPRLVVEEEDREQIDKQDQEDLEEDMNLIEEQARSWEDQTLSQRSKGAIKSWKNRRPQVPKGSRRTPRNLRKRESGS